MSLLIYDVDGNGSVTISDLFMVAGLFGRTTSSVDWNPDADMDGDGAITVADIFAVSPHFGDVAGSLNIHFSANPTSGPAPLNVTFTYEVHHYEGLVTKVEIDYGDGNWIKVDSGSATVLEGMPPHTYPSSGSFPTKIRATDDDPIPNVVEKVGPTISVQ